MISKKQLIEIWCNRENKENPKYAPLFTVNGFMRLMQGTFMNQTDQEYYFSNTNGIKSWYGTPMINKDFKDAEWSEDFWKDLIKAFIKIRLTYTYSLEWEQIIAGVIALLEIYDIPHLSKEDVKEDYKRFYNGTKFGYFNIPYIIDVATYFSIDIEYPLSYFKGFVTEEEIPKFDMDKWKELFPKSKQITTLKDTVTTGVMLDSNEFPVYEESGRYKHFEIAEKFYPDAEYMNDIHKLFGKFIPLRKLNTGAGYAEELITQGYAWLAGFVGRCPIYKINTVQGFSFYIHNGVYIDDISIKKIIFGSAKPVSLDKDTEKRIFIVYNRETGYWQLPELYYPEKFKNFLVDLLKKQKKTIGKWSDTVVFANSRTLNGIHDYSIRLKDYPDIRTKEEFIEKIVQNAIDKALSNLKLGFEYNSLGLKVNVSFDNGSFDFDKQIKKLNCVTQEDIDIYLNGDVPLTFTLEKYK